MSRYRNTLLAEDFEQIEAAQKTYRHKVRDVYAHTAQAGKMGRVRRSPELCQLADEWQADAEMVVATTFDLQYLPAQMKRRNKQGIDTTELGQIIAATQGRHDAAQARLPDLTQRLQELYDSLKHAH